MTDIQKKELEKAVLLLQDAKAIIDGVKWAIKQNNDLSVQPFSDFAKSLNHELFTLNNAVDNIDSIKNELHFDLKLFK